MSHALVARRAAEPSPFLQERLCYPVHRRMIAVLDLGPVLASPRLIGLVVAFRRQTLKPELARLAEQVRPDFSLFEIAHEDAVRSVSQETRKIGVPH